MWSFAALCDQFYVNTRLYLKLDLEPARDTVMHFLDQVRKRYPGMTRLRRRDEGGLVLDEDADVGEPRRVLRVDPVTLKFGYYSPPDRAAVEAYGELILLQAPVNLSLNDLDYDYLEVVYAFDLEYRGNHDALVAETLFADHPLLSALTAGDERMIDCQPFLGVTLTEDCGTQAYVEVKGRTSTFELRSGEFDPVPLTVYVTIRRYWGLAPGEDLVRTHRDLLAIGERFAAERAVPHLVQPLAAAIASRR